MDIEQNLYETICGILPIACVDLVVTNDTGAVLLVKRRLAPARNQWWLPGGRVLFGETREAAAVRKLQQECGLRSESVTEVRTFDLILDYPGETRSHAITTVFHCEVRGGPIMLDSQSSSFAWCSQQQRTQMRLHRFVAASIELGATHAARPD